MAAFSSAGQLRRRPAPVNTSMRRARSGLCISSEIDMCRSSKPAPNVTPHARRWKVQPRRRLRTFSHRATCCPARHAPAGQLDALVWDDLCALLSEPEPLAAAVARAHGGAWLPQELQARRETLRRSQVHLGQQIERLTDAYLRAVMPLDEYERRRRDLEQRARALAEQEEQLRSDAARRQQLAGMAASLEAFRERVQGGLAQASFEQRRQLVLLLIDRVIVTDAEVEIRYVLPTSPDSEHVRFCQLRKHYFDRPVLADGPTK